MELKYSKEMSGIENCPLSNEKGDIEVVRLVKSNPATNEDIKPHSLIHTKLSSNCLAWGLSVYKKPQDINDVKNVMSKRLKGKYTLASVFKITDEMGVKYQTTENLKHYTFFPKKDLDLLSIFVTETI